MFFKTEYFNRFVSVASELYSTRAPIESVLINAGIPVEAINLTGSGISSWNSAISYADKHNKHVELIHIIEKEFAHNPEVQEIKKAIEDGSAFITEIAYEDYIQPNLLTSTAKVFIIYDHEDYKPYVEDLIMQLNTLTFPPSKIKLLNMYKVTLPGGNEEEEQLKNMGTSDIVLLCITPRFLGNPENKCLPLAFTAYQMSKWVVPVLLIPCLWNRIKFLEDIHPLPKNSLFVAQWADPNLAYVDIVKGLVEVVEFIK